MPTLESNLHDEPLMMEPLGAQGGPLEHTDTYKGYPSAHVAGIFDTVYFDRAELQAVAALSDLQRRAKTDPELAAHFTSAGWDLKEFSFTNIPDTRTINGLLNLGREYECFPKAASQESQAVEPSLSAVALASAKRFGGKVIIEGGKLSKLIMESGDESGDMSEMVEALNTPENRKKMVVAATILGVAAQIHPYTGTAPETKPAESIHQVLHPAVSHVGEPFIKLADKIVPEAKESIITPKKAADNIQALAQHLQHTAKQKQLPGEPTHPVALLVGQAADHYVKEVAKHDPESAELARSTAALVTTIATHPKVLDKKMAAALAQPESAEQKQLAERIKQELFDTASDPDYMDPDQAAALSNLVAMLAMDSLPQAPAPAEGQIYVGKHAAPNEEAASQPAPVQPEAAAKPAFDLQAALKAMEAKGNQDHANWANAATAIDFFVGKGLTLEQSTGIIGNFWLESAGVNPAQKQYNGGPGRGLAQWEVGGRWDTLLNFAAANRMDPYALDTQLEFTWHELNSNRSYALEKVRETATPEDSAVAFEKYFEVAGVPALEARSHAARMLFDELHAHAKPQPAKHAAPATAPAPIPAAPLQAAAHAELPPNPNVPTKINNVTHWSQHDHRWADQRYSAIGDPEQTISTSGCEPTAMAMVISTLTGAVVTPPDMAKFALAHGDRTANSGTTSDAIAQAAQAYGLRATPVHDADGIRAALSANQQSPDTLVMLNGQDFNPLTPPTTSGHWYVISQDAGSGMVKVNDPNSIVKSEQTWNLQQLVNASTSMWVISK